MADRINPNRKNRLSPKDILKRSAALTLLLSTAACTEVGNSLDFLCLVPFVIGLLAPIVIGIANFFTPHEKQPPQEKGGWSADSDPNEGRH